MTTPRTVYARQGDTLDLLLHRHTGQTAGNTEATLAANPGLADLGDVLPHGTAIEIPDDVLLAPSVTDLPLIQLWD